MVSPNTSPTLLGVLQLLHSSTSFTGGQTLSQREMLLQGRSGKGLTTSSGWWCQSNL